MIRRRDFIAAAGASGVLAAVAQPLSAAGSVTPGSVTPGAVTPVEVDTHGSLIDADFDYSWLDRMTGKHKAVFESLEVAEGAAFFRANMWRNQYKQVYNTDPKDMNAVVVLRHHGFALAMSDAYWQKYEVAKEFKINDDDGNPLKSNPVGETAKGSNTLAAFVESGGIVLGCNVAFGAVLGTLRRKEKLSREEADKVGRTYLLPGVILQPSGVFAALRAQEAGCSYIIAS